MKKYIKDQYDSILTELETNCSKQRKRHLESELEMLSQYMKDNPDSIYTPNSLELYCNLNPEAPECRIYE